MAEHDETYDIQIEFAALSVVDDNAFTVSKENQIAKLQTLESKELRSLLLTMRFASELKNMCDGEQKSKYMPVNMRKYILLFISLILKDDNTDRGVLLEVFGCPVARLPYIKKNHRTRFWNYFSPWKDSLLSISYTLKTRTPYLYWNGEFNEECEFIKKLRTLPYVYFFEAIGSSEIHVFGSSLEETFLTDIASVTVPVTVTVQYTMSPIRDSSNSKSGDKLESSLVESHFFPLIY
jgi:hypothetical protein